MGCDGRGLDCCGTGSRMRRLRRRGDRRGGVGRCGGALASISPFEVSPGRVEGTGFGNRPIGIVAAGQPAKIHGDFDQTDQAAEVHQGVGMALLVALHGGPAGAHPEQIGSQFAIHGPLSPKRGQRGEFIVRRVGHGVASIGPGEDRFPFSHPTTAFLTFATFTLDDHGVEETRRQTGEPAMGAKGAAVGDQGVAEVVGGAPKHTHSGTKRTPGGGTHGEAD